MRTHDLSLIIRLKNPQFTTEGFFYERNVPLIFGKSALEGVKLIEIGDILSP